MAFRMQIERPGADGPRAARPKETLDLYGAEPGKPSFANNCLLARRLVERGVRFVNIYPRGLGPPRRRGRRTCKTQLRRDRPGLRRRWSRT